MGFVDPGSNEQTFYGGVGKHSLGGFLVEHIRQHTTGGSKSREGKLFVTAVQTSYGGVGKHSLGGPITSLARCCVHLE